MRFIGETIDATGNFILSKNDTAIYIENFVGITIANFNIHKIKGFRNKIKSSLAALMFIWWGVQ